MDFMTNIREQRIFMIGHLFDKVGQIDKQKTVDVAKDSKNNTWKGIYHLSSNDVHVLVMNSIFINIISIIN